jgi:hypothetical protein
MLLVCVVLAFVAVSCGHRETGPRAVFSRGGPGTAHGVFQSGGVARGGGNIWIAYTDAGDPRQPVVRIVRVAEFAREGAKAKSPAVVAEFSGLAAGLVVMHGGGMAVAYHEGGDSSNRILFRRGSSDGRTWGNPVRIALRAGVHDLANGRLVETSGGILLLPAVWRASGPDSAAASDVVPYASKDNGGTWQELGSLRVAGAADPAVAEAANGELVLVLRAGTRLLRAGSTNGGKSWSALTDLGFEVLAAPHALGRVSDSRELALAWTGPPGDSTVTKPDVMRLELAFSSDAGRTWRRAGPLALRAGRVPAAPALVCRDGRLVVLFEDRSGGARLSALTCIADDLHRLEGGERLPPPEHARGRYSLDPPAAREALAVLSEHTLGRSAPSIRLFIEGYYMRSLVAAHAVLGPLHRQHPYWIDTQEGLEHAVSFADWLVQGQAPSGYWPLGYKALYVADMAVAVGLFAALEPYVEDGRRRRYEAAAARFVEALERDGMILPSGACGIGWADTRAVTPERALRTPYLVSTALAGIEVQAWLFERTGRPEYRERALRSLDYTLSQIGPDGSLPYVTREDGPLATAAYVQEGWMAADAFLQDHDVLAKLRRALPAHVTWLLRSQRADGTWDSGAEGEFARTPAIVDFLIWYDQRCEGRADVRLAVRRGSAALIDPDRWLAAGVFGTGKHEDVLRAVMGRPLAALAQEHFVF